MIRRFFFLIAMMLTWPVLAGEKEGGIIGTGVIGQITGLGHFEVSGMRFDFAPDIELKGVKSVDDLDMGMTLALSTGLNGNSWQIETLRHMPLLSGPITGPGEVMGVAVAGVLPDQGSVQVDGFWSEGGIFASRVADWTEETAQVSGMYDGQGRVGQVVVAGVNLSGIEAGETLTVTGQFVHGALIVDTVMQGPFMDVSPELVLLEGFFLPEVTSTSWSLQGIAVSDAGDAAKPDELVRRCALRGRADFSRVALTPAEDATVRSFCVSASN